MASDFLSLDHPVAHGGIESVRFFNGRLLSGKDLTREQTARRSADSLAGMALGSGIAYGLEVIRTSDDKASEGAVVTVRAGLSVNRDGALLHLPFDQRVQLTRTDSTDFSQPGECQFGDCVIPETSAYVAGEGLYILALSPSRRSAGRAAVNGLQGDSPGCNVDRDIDAVRFRLIEIPSNLYAGISAAEVSFRNQIAYRCFGSGVMADWPVKLTTQGRRDDDLLSAMEAHGLARADVPLAIVAFTGTLDVNFVDSWSARRPLAIADGQPMPGAGIASSVSARRTSAGRAMFQQFQDHFAELTNNGASIGEVRARTHFPTLPPVGILPKLSKQAALAFFGGMTVRGPVHINAAQVEPLLRESLSTPAIRSASNEVVWLYAVAENMIAGIKASADDGITDPYLIFASGNVPYRADARFNLHRWNYANFALAG
jgi:hypothetical protein